MWLQISLLIFLSLWSVEISFGTEGKDPSNMLRSQRNYLAILSAYPSESDEFIKKIEAIGNDAYRVELGRSKGKCRRQIVSVIRQKQKANNDRIIVSKVSDAPICL